jgi:hypothetical protein
MAYYISYCDSKSPRLCESDPPKDESGFVNFAGTQNIDFAEGKASLGNCYH